MAGIRPTDLMVMERERVYRNPEDRKKIREDVITEWRNQWNQCSEEVDKRPKEVA